MPSLKAKGIALLGSLSGVDMKTVASTTIFTTDVGKMTRIAYIVVRDTSASLAGGTSYSFTSFRQTVDLSSLTTLGTDYIMLDGNNTKYVEINDATAFQITVTTGSTAACTATIDVFGYTV
jgi:hypothetical protein